MVDRRELFGVLAAGSSTKTLSYMGIAHEIVICQAMGEGSGHRCPWKGLTLDGSQVYQVLGKMVGRLGFAEQKTLYHIATDVPE